MAAVSCIVVVIKLDYFDDTGAILLLNVHAQGHGSTGIGTVKIDIQSSINFPGESKKTEKIGCQVIHGPTVTVRIAGRVTNKVTIREFSCFTITNTRDGPVAGAIIPGREMSPAFVKSAAIGVQDGLERIHD